MSTLSNQTLWVTQTAYDRLQAELTELTALTGAEREAAEVRIVELRGILRRAEVGDKPDDGLVEAGMQITVTFARDTEPTTFLLAHRELAGIDPSVDLEAYSPDSPLGQAIVGKFAGEDFSFSAPNGAQISGTIVAATPFHG
ncbi:hypothetical protein ASD65_12535 [Microbacterium sp. Root61]|uniref:GreA/GreB family elongation factor n=1 Tax=Microbacterium sp. Root61 TaxID=1736570 RepID=UPI0006F4ADDA|nr:GreA/GreB family elongation factor [Microbacterium sp. Root61]KRA25156.1 hypothetical protein ASD65_12535 [Microbacterium sp. Root61]